MNQPARAEHRENPFASRFVRPGALPFLISEGADVPHLIECLRRHGWRGAIVGPHGSGKSTLLASVEDALRRAGCEVRKVTAGRSSVATTSRRAASGGRRRILMVDGYDLLPGWKRWWIRRCCRRAGDGLVVTAHRPVALPMLVTTSTSVTLALRLVAMLGGTELAAEYEGLIRNSFARHRGNLREVWFDLYDRYEWCNRPETGGA
jgi:hypothetical protein